MRKKVIILGGGVAGLSAAHELIERGFEVEVYEKLSVPGGKARSLEVSGSGTEGRKDLPGEHGFRFFPGFYEHLPDTMKRIPYGVNKTVFHNLVDTTQAEMARYGLPPIVMNVRFPRTPGDFLQTFLQGTRLLFGSEFGIPEEEVDFFVDRFKQFVTSCEERRLNEYEGLAWWDYIEAEGKSKLYQQYLGIGLTRALVAAKALEASTKTIGDIGAQLIIDMVTPASHSTDRVLNGPTNEVWIEPWLDYLEESGVTYYLNAEVESITCKENGYISHVTIKKTGDNSTFDVKGDYYIVAVPVEVMGRLLRKESSKGLLKADPALKNILKIAGNVEHMTGMQLYLTEDVEIVHGHSNYIDSHWALTSISQRQFWEDFNFREYGDGRVKGILSVDISEWKAPGIIKKKYKNGRVEIVEGAGKKAIDCTEDEIKDEVWEQIKLSLNRRNVVELKDEFFHSYFFPPSGKPRAVKKREGDEPLLVNLIDTWHLRPHAFTRIPNLFLASDYVQTNTDLATMEGANEAARRAVNYILKAAGSPAKRCRIWPLHEPELLQPWRMHDRHRFRRGLPWNGELLSGDLDYAWDSFKRRLSGISRLLSDSALAVPRDLLGRIKPPK